MINLCRYHLEETSIDSRWDTFVESSPNGTIFMKSSYLAHLDARIQVFYCYKSNEIVGGLLALLDDSGTNVVGHDYVIYDGLVYRDFSGLNRSKRISEEHKVQRAVADFVLGKFSSAKFTLHYSISDIRAFLWANYHSDGPQYVPDVRYTSFIRTVEFKESTPLEKLDTFKNASVSRRQEIRYANKSNVETKLTDDSSKFVDLYKKTMGRQGIELEYRQCTELESLIGGLIQTGHAFIVESMIADSGQTGSMVVLLKDQNIAYYLFGANDPELRRHHTGTAVIWDSLTYLNTIGIETLDLEGVNSPARGWFKTSFGGHLQPYFSVGFQKEV